jgi:hypothetical protein
MASMRPVCVCVCVYACVCAGACDHDAPPLIDVAGHTAPPHLPGLQVRALVRAPPPQVALQSLQGLHSSSTASTGAGAVPQAVPVYPALGSHTQAPVPG